MDKKNQIDQMNQYIKQINHIIIDLQQKEYYSDEKRTAKSNTLSSLHESFRKLNKTNTLLPLQSVKENYVDNTSTIQQINILNQTVNTLIQLFNSMSMSSVVIPTIKPLNHISFEGYGEWVQYQTQPSTISSYTIQPISNNLPNNIYLLGSSDQIIWYYLDAQFNLPLQGSLTFTILESLQNNFSYYRLFTSCASSQTSQKWSLSCSFNSVINVSCSQPSYMSIDSGGVVCSFPSLMYYMPQYVNSTHTEFFASSLSVYLGEWIQVKLSTPIVLSKYSLACRFGSDSKSDSNRNATRVVLCASNDSIHWSLLHSADNVTYVDQTDRTFVITNQTAYSYYRLIAIELDNNDWSLSKLNLYENNQLYTSSVECTSSIPLCFFYEVETHPISSIIGKTNYNNWIDMLLNLPNGYSGNYNGYTMTIIS